MLIGGQDVLLPTTMVGNYPNPRWYDGHAFATLPKGEFIYDSISKEAFEDTVGAIVRDQEAAGLDVISDGQVYGGDSPYGTILYYYLERVSGYRLYGMGDSEIDALNASMKGVNCDFWVHTCWGNYSGTPAYFPDETDTEFGAFRRRGVAGPPVEHER